MDEFEFGPNYFAITAWDATNKYFIHMFGQSCSVNINYQFTGTIGVQERFLREDLTYTEGYFYPDESTDVYRDYGAVLTDSPTPPTAS